MNSRFFYAVAILGYFGLFILLMAWTLWLAPPTIFPVVIVLLFYIGPMLFAMRGMLNKKLYTFGWTQFMSLFYFMVGIVIAASNAEERWLAMLQIIFSLMWFVGGMLFIRKTAKEIS
jgi:uncharacterized membrane protein